MWAWLLLLSLATLAAAVFGRRNRGMVLPPGPRALIPLLSGLHQLEELRDPENVARAAAKYGPIFTIRLGPVPVILITGMEAAHEAFVEQGSVFGTHPSSMDFSSVVFSNNRRNINTAPVGSYWRSVRRHLSAAIASNKLETFACARERAVERLVSELAATTGTEVLLRGKLSFAVSSILAYICFGSWLDDAQLMKLAEITTEELQITVSRSMPCISAMLLAIAASVRGKDPQVLDFAQRRSKFLAPLIDVARCRFAAGELDPNCYLYVLFNADDGVLLSDDDILALVAEVLIVGAETTAVTLEWALACIVKYPQVQERLVSEMAHEDANLTYLDAFIKEVLRVYPPGLSTLPHGVTRTTKVAGYDIPANAVVFVHSFTMGKDPQVWERANEFKPERFLPPLTPPLSSYAPFGIGRRTCPGQALAHLHLRYFLVRLLKAFHWSATEEVEMSSTFKFTLVMKMPLKAVVQERVK